MGVIAQHGVESVALKANRNVLDNTTQNVVCVSCCKQFYTLENNLL